MKVSIAVQILPRLEFFYLEEWINYHLNIGIDKIYIYNNGFRSITDPNQDRWQISHRELSNEDKIIGKWGKKPDEDYFLDFSEKEIEDYIQTISEKFYPYVLIKSWIHGIDHDIRHPKSQIRAYNDAIKNFQSDWWLFIDPDEYVNLFNHIDIKEFIYEYPNICQFKIGQRVFKNRTRDREVLSITEYAYDLPNLYKSLSVSNSIALSCHDVKPNNGEIQISDFNEIRLNHYRGMPFTRGSDKAYCEGAIGNEMNKYDNSINNNL